MTSNARLLTLCRDKIQELENDNSFLEALLEKEQEQSLDIIRTLNTRIENLEQALETEQRKSEEILRIATDAEYRNSISRLSLSELLRLNQEGEKEYMVEEKQKIKENFNQRILRYFS
jgi:CII-binding regulator of phage lambda lysogenization HflD